LLVVPLEDDLFAVFDCVVMVTVDPDMAVYKTLSPKNKKALKQFYELLCKCFPQTPPKVTRTTPGQSRSTVSSAANSSDLWRCLWETFT
jgi:hypothetical protein